MEHKCSSYNVKIANDKGAVIFKCPSCGKHEIVRSLQARQNAAQYKCPECGFVGPN
ncbi:DUF1610 domain-containing protein [archaeon]|jgi:Zn-ribbon RNA-binding protein|nr:DUF1610 domain-containing protein [archaeon]MBT4351349.1 DUF1610 domain-containing protein [archaeon]MBT4646769.1 DUF1610 domain-containing protein [archaeon]MBT6822062.1 DUF1610 domain-containing protein [archaeon]MBT7391448.1 DUF1610 domain-containing protein [archaeon]